MSDVQLIRGDCLDVLRGLEAGSVDAIVTDPPSGIAFMSRNWDTFKCRSAFVDFLAPRLAECLRVARPGARMLCWGLPRTSHWTATAIEDAGWLIECKVYHIFGSGFPKGKGQLKPAVEEWITARRDLNFVPGFDKITEESTNLVECLLWSLSPAKLAASCSTLVPIGTAEDGSGSVRWLVAVARLVGSLGPSAMMAMFNSRAEGLTFLSTAISWLNILAVLSASGNTSTTRTASDLTTGLRILNSWISAIIPDNIIRAASRRNGLWSSAGPAGDNSSGGVCGWRSIPKPSAPSDVTWQSVAGILGSLARLAVECSLPLRVISKNSVPRLVPIDSATDGEWLGNFTSASDAGKSSRPSRAEGAFTADGNVWHSPTGSEEWVLARKPGGKVPDLNVDACRIGTGEGRAAGGLAKIPSMFQAKGRQPERPSGGRWPATLCLSHHPACRQVGTKRVKGSHDVGKPINGTVRHVYGGFPAGATTHGYAGPDGLESVVAWECHAQCPVAELDAMSGARPGDRPGRKPRKAIGFGADFMDDAWQPDGPVETAGFADSGGASRFFATFPGEAEALYFYAPKASRRDRGEGNLHPTVKAQLLMRWLIRLICKPGDTLVDPFAGSGSTLLAAMAEGVNAIGIEDDSEPGSFATAERRLAAARLPLGFG